MKLGWVAVAGTLGLLGCSQQARYQILAFLFEGVPEPGEEYVAKPVVRQPRHPRPPTPLPTATPIAVVKGEVELRTWEDVRTHFPKDLAGGVDWVQALADETIAPRVGLEAGTEPEAPMEMELELASTANPAFRVLFSHKAHTEWLGCPNCHTDIFEMQAGAAAIKMADLYEGKYCAVCHGPVAFSIADGCARCHLDRLPKDAQGNVDWVRALNDKVIEPRAGLGAKSAAEDVLSLDVELSHEGSAIKSVFSHESHTAWLACSNCHDGIFQMAAGTAKMTMESLYAGRYCGVCHGPVAFGLATGCQRCHLSQFPTDEAGTVDWVRALANGLIDPKPGIDAATEPEPVFPLELELESKTQPGLTAVFSHQSHTAWLGCANCHPAIFAQEAGNAAITMENMRAGNYCGVCHGSVAFGLDGACARCHPAMSGGS